MRPTKYAETTQIFLQSAAFYGTHLLLVAGLMMVAALARVGLADGFGPVPKSGKVSLEVVTEASRIALVLAVIGGGSLLKGAQLLPRILRIFSGDTWRTIASNTAHLWWPLLINILAFSLLAGAINLCINLVANESVLQLLKDWRLLAKDANPQAIVLFLKNLTIIPFTIIFLYYVLARLISR